MAESLLGEGANVLTLDVAWYAQASLGGQNLDMGADALFARGDRDSNEKFRAALVECIHGDDEDGASARLLPAAPCAQVRHPHFSSCGCQAGAHAFSWSGRS